MQSGSMRGLIELIARALVDHPDEVTVNEVVRDSATVLELRVAEGDMGKVIGKQGRTARAIRAILSASGSKDKRRVVLEILE
jgi:predicted RNA-binding protein YlqC (UPF0109 family)